MKFDYVTGNPPYQLETTNVSLSNGQLRSKSIFHYFQIEADKIANSSCFRRAAYRLLFAYLI